MGAPPPLRHVWLSRVMNGDTEQISNHLNSKNIQVQNIVKVSHSDAKFASFKISVFKNDLNTVLKASLWPRGLRCEQWYERRLRAPSVAESDVVSVVDSDEASMTGNVPNVSSNDVPSATADGSA